MTASNDAGGLDALRRLKSADPPLYLSPSPDLSQAARVASEHIFSSLRPFTPKSPFDHLLVNGFDAEQIWQQIDLQSQPLISSLRRELNKFEKNPDEILKLFDEVEKAGLEKGMKDDLERESGGFGELDGAESDDLEGFDEENEEEDSEEKSIEEEEEEEGEEEEEEEGGGDEGGVGVEDRFLKIKELEEYLEEDEAREYGLENKKKEDGKVSNMDEDGDEEDDEEGDEEEDDELGLFGDGVDDEDGAADALENVSAIIKDDMLTLTDTLKNDFDMVTISKIMSNINLLKGSPAYETSTYAGCGEG